MSLFLISCLILFVFSSNIREELRGHWSHWESSSWRPQISLTNLMAVLPVDVSVWQLVVALHHSVGAAFQSEVKMVYGILLGFRDEQPAPLADATRSLPMLPVKSVAKHTTEMPLFWKHQEEWQSSCKPEGLTDSSTGFRTFDCEETLESCTVGLTHIHIINNVSGDLRTKRLLKMTASEQHDCKYYFSLSYQVLSCPLVSAKRLLPGLKSEARAEVP